MRALPLRLLLLAATGLTGCFTLPLDAPPPELADRFPAAEKTQREAWEAELDVESEALTGRFHAVAIADVGRAPRVRFQLLPDVGGKVLDLAATPDGARGYMPHAGVVLDAIATDDEPLPRHPIVLFAATLLERATPVSFERLRGARREPDGGWTLDLVGALAGVEVRVALDAAGSVLRRDYRFRGARWREEFGPSTHRIESASMTIDLSAETAEVVPVDPAAADDVFALELPPGPTP